VRLAHRFEQAALVALDRLLGLMSLDRASATMGWLWRRLAPFNARHRRADGNLARALPELSPAERRRILDGMWDNLGRVAAETLRLSELAADPSRVLFKDDDLLAEVEASGRGVVFVSLHTGNWEVVSVPLWRRGLAAHAVYKRLKNPLSEAFLLERRRGLYAGLLAVNHLSPLYLRSIIRSGDSVDMMADLRDGSGTTVPFFGRPAGATTAPALIARRLGAPMIAARCVRLEGAHFRIDAARVATVRTDDARADALAMTEALHRQFETWIRQHPEQWMWGHRKWPD
jgi:KDO2-lipid IV(A) lauroyltransferase